MKISRLLLAIFFAAAASLLATDEFDIDKHRPRPRLLALHPIVILPLSRPPVLMNMDKTASSGFVRTGRDAGMAASISRSDHKGGSATT